MDFEKIRLGRPTFKMEKYVDQSLVDSKILKQTWLRLRKNSFEAQDYYLQLSEPDEHGEFYDLSETEIYNTYKKLSPNKIYEVHLQLQSQQVRNDRKVYSLLELIGDLGGVFEIIILTLNFLMLPISRHSFIL